MRISWTPLFWRSVRTPSQKLAHSLLDMYMPRSSFLPSHVRASTLYRWLVSLNGSSRPLPYNAPHQATRWNTPGPEAGFSSSVFPEVHGPLCCLWPLPICGRRTAPSECRLSPLCCCRWRTILSASESARIFSRLRTTWGSKVPSRSRGVWLFLLLTSIPACSCARCGGCLSHVHFL